MLRKKEKDKMTMDRELTQLTLSFATQLDHPQGWGLALTLLRAHAGCGREDATDQQRSKNLGNKTQAFGMPHDFSVFDVTMVKAEY